MEENKTTDSIVKSLVKQLYQKGVLKSPITRKCQLENIAIIDAVENSVIAKINALIIAREQLAIVKALELVGEEAKLLGENMYKAGDYVYADIVTVCNPNGADYTYEVHKQSILSLKDRVIEELRTNPSQQA